MMMNDNKCYVNSKYYLVKYVDTDKNTILVDVFKKMNGKFVNVISNDPLDLSKNVICECTMIGNTLSCFISSLSAQYQKCIDDIDTFDKKAYYDSLTLFNNINHNPFIGTSPLGDHFIPPYGPLGNPYMPYNEYMNIMFKDEKIGFKNDDVTAPITPEEVKAIGALYDIDQITKYADLINDDHYREQLELSSRRLEKDLKDTFGEPTEEDQKRFESLFDPNNKTMKKYKQMMDDALYSIHPLVFEGYVDLNDSEAAYNSPSNDKDWKYTVKSCCESETFIITAVAGSETRTYAFLDENYHILQKAELNESFNRKEIIAPKGSRYLVVNSKDILQVKRNK